MSADQPTPEQLALITRELADIDLPAAPDWGPLYLVIALLLAVTILATALQLRHRRRQLTPHTVGDEGRHHALARLAELESNWRNHSCDPQTLGFRLATTLRLGLKLNRLDPEPPLATIDKAAWQQLYQRLYQLRYGYPADAGLIDQELFEQIGRYIDLYHTDAAGPPRC